MTKQFRSRELPPLQRMIALQAMPGNDNSPLYAGALEPTTHLSYADLVLIQQEEGIHHDWHDKIIAGKPLF
jgi:hypothetical protein